MPIEGRTTVENFWCPHMLTLEVKSEKTAWQSELGSPEGFPNNLLRWVVPMKLMECCHVPTCMSATRLRFN